MKAIRLGLFSVAAAIVLMLVLYPEAIAARWALYGETLTPGAEHSEFADRAWGYPLDGAIKVFYRPNWLLGNGLGTSSLGAQYVSHIVRTGLPQSVESGIGELVLEFGVAGPFLWAIWVGSLLGCAWKVLRRLRGTSLYPIGFAIFWFAVYTLALGFFYGLYVYQNYLSNAYLWLTVGMLFRFPGLLAEQKKSAGPLLAHDRIGS